MTMGPNTLPTVPDNVLIAAHLRTEFCIEDAWHVAVEDVSFA